METTQNNTTTTSIVDDPLYKEYCKLVDTSILRYINDTSGTDLCASQYHDFFDYGLKDIDKILPAERELQIDGANFCQNAFCIGADPTKVGEILAEALFNYGWCE